MAYDGNATVQYFEGRRFVGEARVYCCGYAGGDGKRSSAYWPHVAWFCQICGEIWGRAVYQHEFNYAPLLPLPWIIRSRPCPKHGDGTFLETAHLDSCSTSLLAREVQLLLEHHHDN